MDDNQPENTEIISPQPKEENQQANDSQPRTKESDFYNNIRVKIDKYIKSKDSSENQWSKYLLLAPDLFYLLWKLSLDKDVPGKHKAKLVGTIAYFISPIDLLPEGIIGPIGYLDDMALAAHAINSLVNDVGPEIVKKYWPGEDDALEVIQSILQQADKMVGSGLWEKVKKKFEKFTSV